MSIPAVQRAWVSVRKGVPSKSLELKTDWPVKQPGSGEVLVKIQASALNPIGYKMLKLLPDFLAKRPYIPEHDFSGFVVDSNNSQEYSNGDQVYGWIRLDAQLKSKQGVLAEYISISQDNIQKRPSNVSAIEAAGVSLVALTALQSLDTVKLEQDQTILINGGSTAVGSYAIQLAKIRGAKVIATASGKNEKFVRDVGADEFIDYTKVGPLHEYFSKNSPSTKFNVIFDAVGMFDPSLYTYSKRYLAPNGVFISAGPQPHGFNLATVSQFLRLGGAMIFPSFLTGIKGKFKISGVVNKVDDMKLLREYLEQGKLKPKVDSTFEFDDVLQAYEKILSSRAVGKVTIKVDPSA
ncbi:hypothetical protein EST38_g4734 [Candolleomyces aberdarensis]|uniref:Enoyl reductase (ER) domain-containing protein n=1 Tax=Candolleomyces aberdarensis TaxID=2316362 RepID=A0A4Q2DNZ1_9AGAR|nr:hypothetical protein EST38_g4734 [Candolleomyces aberdarensis]